MVRPPITIGINGSMLDHEPSGLGIYSINLINHLFLLYNNNEQRDLTVFTPSYKFLHPGLKIVKLFNIMQSSKYGRMAAVSRFLWNTLVYPFSALKYDLLLSPTTHASFIFNSQILTIHDLLSLRFGNINAHQRIYYKYLLPLIVKRSNVIVTVSEASKKDIVEFLHCAEDKIKVVHNGYDKTCYNTEAEPSRQIRSIYGIENYFLVVGPTYAHKNTGMVLEAYSRLTAKERNFFPLVIAGGKQPYLNAVKLQVAQLNLENEVYFLGYVAQMYMPALYREAFALLFPSRHEGFGFPLLEAMACGCPVITSNVSSMPEVCGDAALYIDPNDSDSLFTAIGELIGSPSTRSSLVQKGLKQVEKFSWEKSALAIQQIIENYCNTIKKNADV